MSPQETAAAEKLVGECLGFLREHAEHEDRHVLPEIARLAPELAAVMAEEHPELERAAIAVDSLWPRLAPLGPEERQAMGGELARRFQALVAMQLRHMDREEREVNAVFWARLADRRHRGDEPPHRGQHAARAPAHLAAAAPAARLERAGARGGRGAAALADLAGESGPRVASTPVSARHAASSLAILIPR